MSQLQRVINRTCSATPAVTAGLIGALLGATISAARAEDVASQQTLPPALERAPSLAEAGATGTPSPAGTTEQLAPTPPGPAPRPSNVWSRPNASGDWWGARSELANSGVNLRLWATGFYQGQWSGEEGTFTSEDGRGTKFLTGGRLDALVDLDTTKLGLWRGGGFHSHLELEGGRVPGFRGGALWPVNAGAILPLDSPEQLEATYSPTIRSSEAGASIAS